MSRHKQAALVIRGLVIRGFDYSRFSNWYQILYPRIIPSIIRGFCLQNQILLQNITKMSMFGENKNSLGIRGFWYSRDFPGFDIRGIFLDPNPRE